METKSRFNLLVWPTPGSTRRRRSGYRQRPHRVSAMPRPISLVLGLTIRTGRSVSFESILIFIWLPGPRGPRQIARFESRASGQRHRGETSSCTRVASSVFSIHESSPRPKSEPSRVRSWLHRRSVASALGTTEGLLCQGHPICGLGVGSR